MAEKVTKIKLAAETGEAASKINDLKKDLGGLSSALNAQEFQNRFNQISQSSMPVKKQIREISKLLTDMNLEGLSNTSVFTEAAEYAGNLKDAVADAGQAINRFADDSFNLTAAADGLSMVAAAGSIATGVMGAFGVENDNVTKAILKVQSAMAILNGVQTIANKLNKDSALMQKLKQIRLKATTAATAGNTTSITANSVATTANTVATGANTAATTLATKAKNSFNTAVAVGKAIMGDWTGIAILAAAGIATFAMNTDKSTDAQEKNNKKTEEAKTIYTDYADRVASSAGEIVGKFMFLQQQYVALQTTAEKIAFLKQHKQEIDALGLSVDSLTAAEDVFVNNTDAVIDAFEQRAKAAALQQVLTDAYTDYYNTLKKVEQQQAKMPDPKKATYQGPKSAVGYSMPDNWKAAGLTNDDVNWESAGGGRLKYTMKNSGVQKMDRIAQLAQADMNNKLNLVDAGATANAQKELKASQDFVKKEYADAMKAFDESGVSKYFKKSGAGAGSKTKMKQTVDILTAVDDGSLKMAQDKLKAFEDLKTKIDVNDKKALDNCQKNIDNWKDEVEKRKVELGIIVPDGPLQKVQKEIKELEDKRLYLDPEVDAEQIIECNKKIEKLKKEEIDIKVKLGIEKAEVPANSLKGIQDEINKLNDTILTLDPTIDLAKFKECQDKIKELTEKKHKIEIETEMADDISINMPDTQTIKRGSAEDKRQSWQNAQAQVQQLQEDVRLNIIGADEAMSKIDEINAKLKALDLPPIKMHIEDDGSLATQAEHTQRLADSISAVSGSFSTLGQSMSNLAGENEALAKSALIATAIGELGLSFAKAMANHKSFTVWDWIAAGVAGVATLTSMIASLQSFSTGGIVQGQSSVNDGIVARLNPGELVLNKHQQSNLYNMLNNGGGNSGGMSGHVEFKLTGKELKGVLRNYDNAQTKLK